MADKKYLSILNGYVICDDEARARLDALEGETANSSVEISSSWDFTKDSDKWESIGTDENPKYQIRIQKDEYINWFNKIISVTAEKITDLGGYENMVYSRKWFLSGSVAIITNYPIDIHITIKGTK